MGFRWAGLLLEGGIRYVGQPAIPALCCGRTFVFVDDHVLLVKLAVDIACRGRRDDRHARSEREGEEDRDEVREPVNLTTEQRGQLRWGGERSR